MSEGLSFATAVDTSGFEEGMQRIEEGVKNASATIEGQSERIQYLFNNIPEVDINFVTNMPETADQIGEAYAEISRVTRLNQDAIADLSQEYNRLTGEINKFQNVPQKRDEVKQWREEKKAIQENISIRKEIIAKTQELTKVVDQNAKSFDNHAKIQNNVKLRIKEIIAEMANLRNEAQMQGKEIDESTGRYRELAEELGRLKDIQGDVATQAKILSNDENQFQGLISGLSGLSGGFSAAQGAMALFGSENENLQKVMTQLQAVMAITIGLQQVQQMLNKDSAFRLVTLNSLRSLWNKLIGESNEVQATENAEIGTNIALTETQTTAEEQNTIAEEANATARAANNKVTNLGTKEEIAETAATRANTAAQEQNTGAVVASTTATKAATLATKLFKVALASTGIGLIIIAIGELVSWIGEMINKEDDAVKHTKELNKIHEDAAKTYIQEKIALDDNIKMCQNFTGTKEQEKKKVDELNSKYGEALGYYDSLEQWEKVLTERGPKYCEMLQMKAEQQGLLNKYVEAYVEALAVANKAENGEFDRGWYNPARWFGESNKERQDRIKEEANKETKYWKEEMEKQKKKLEDFQKENHFDEIHIDPKKNNTGGKGKQFNPKEAARKRAEAERQFNEELKKLIKSNNDEITQANIDAMQEGLDKEIKTIQKRTQDLKYQWEQSFLQLAKARQDADKVSFLSQKGNTLEDWEKSDRGKMTAQDYLNEMLADPQYADLAEQYYDRLKQITETEERQINNIRQSYQDKWIEQYGDDKQKEELLTRQWTDKLNKIMAEAPELMPQALETMEKDFRKLDLTKFKDSINWDEIFGNLGEQSLSSLQYSLDKVKAYFEQAKGSMSVTEIKDFQEAITSMENEIANRNPFTALHKSMKDMANAKSEMVDALNATKEAQEELKTAQEEYNQLYEEWFELQELVDKGEMAADDERYVEAETKLAEAFTKVEAANKKSNQAQQQTAKAQNNLTRTTKQFSTNLKNAGGVVTDMGSKAKNLARVFSDDVADSMETALDFIDEVLDATSDVINSIADVGKSVAKGMEGTVDAMGTATKATAQATATSISTVEKASVILTVISAALQIATAIANLFNNDDSHQKEIEALQERIDQLQWELDNQEAIRLRDNEADAMKKLKESYAAATNEVLKLHGVYRNYGFQAWYTAQRYSADILAKSIEKIADYWASVDYASDKALGAKKFEDGRKKIENLAEQQILLQKQINEESSKKKSDSEKIADYQNQIYELAEEMASIINEMVEDIIGSTAEDLAKTLGDAFFDAVAQGEDAMEAWAKTTKELVRDIIKQMLVTKFLEEPMGEIFNTYKKKWFGDDGTFKGVDAVINSADSLANDINKVGQDFSTMWDTLSGSLGKWFEEDEADREGTSKGIATASQESVDENNARLTTIQGHTYTIMQGVQELNGTANAMLEKLSGIEENTNETNEKLNELDRKTKRVADAIETIQTNGLKIK